jgi:tetratricopeptide (TPR) repeat protein
MSTFWKASALTMALMFGSHASADAPPQAAGTDSPPLASQAYRPSPAAEVMYHILVAELAGKREQLQTALEHYRMAALASQDPAVAGRAVGIALFAGDNKAMLEMAQRWQTLAPDNPQARQTLALALLRNNRLDEAVQQLEVVRAAAVEDEQQGFSAVGALLDQVENKEVALQVMEQLRKLQPRSQFALYYYALAALNVKHYEQALEALQTALNDNPQWVPAYLLRARVLMGKGDTDAALKSLAEAVTALPENRELRMGYARLLVNAKRTEEARRQFQILAEQNPKDADALYALGVLATEAKQFDEAVAHFMRVLQLGGPRVMDTYYELGRVEELRKDYRKAKEWYGRVSSDDRYLNAQVRVGVMLAKLGDFPALSAHFLKLRQDNPQEAVVLYVSEAEVLREEKHYQQAFDLLTQTLVQYPGNKDVLYARALAAEPLNRLDILERDLHTLIEADPKNGQALNALGYTLADRTNRYQEALGYLQQAITLLPDDPAVIDSMGWVFYRLGQNDKSLDYLRRAYQLNDDDEIAAHLSEVLWVSGRQQEARETWQHALEKEPSSEHLLKLKERFGW